MWGIDLNILDYIVDLRQFRGSHVLNCGKWKHGYGDPIRNSLAIVIPA